MEESRTERLAGAVAMIGRGASPEVPASLGDWSTEHWRDALLGIPVDERTYEDRFGRTRRHDVERLWSWWTSRGTTRGPAARTTGRLGFLLLTLASMYCSDRVRFHGEQGEEVRVAGTTSAEICRRMVDDPQVRASLLDLYAPGLAVPSGDRPSPAARSEWATVEGARLQFHHHGTTSFILRGRAAHSSQGRTPTFALKCVIYPYLTIPAIAAATRDYLEDYGTLDEDSAPVPHVWASHGSWILMDFLPGRTLAEHLRGRAAERPAPRREILRELDVEALETYGAAVVRALAELQRLGRRHNDLTPSNVIVQEDEVTGVRARFVDLGVNHLHTRSVPGVPPGETVYVAPEVRREGAGDGNLSDLYSLGMLLVAVAGAPHTPDGTVPDAFYVASTGMARLLEDLVDAEPGRRLAVCGAHRSREGAGSPAGMLRRLYDDEVEVLSANRSVDAERDLLDRVRERVPGAEAVARQRRILKVLARQAGSGRAARGRMRPGSTAPLGGAALPPLHASQLRRSRYLRRWSLVCTVALWAATALLLTLWSRDAGIGWQARWLDVATRLPGVVTDPLSVLDGLRLDGHHGADFWGNLPSRLVAFTFALVGLRMYLEIFAALTPLPLGSRRGMLRARTVTAEVALRVLAVSPAVYVLAPTLLSREWWPALTAIGLWTFCLAFWACLWFARDALRRARRIGLSTVPAGEIPTLGRFEQWIPTLLLYASAVLVIGTLLMTGVLHDELAYAAFASVINIAIFYVKNAGTDAPLVRVGLSRAVLAAERLDRTAATTPAGDTPARGAGAVDGTGRPER
ncbi:protein kinase domain-containing protein [Myceligenerans indicum]|uniref:Protein kinase domain-containing protein n=1 Tax=Myceligenerans indicum TaxID=2593663 RepID=A0ABS1LH24_9MICO|nr:hypothetical protein [Myceligenerans indicum]MBL0885522.1 hypothetical protein [Myceligenerans indicum]